MLSRMSSNARTVGSTFKLAAIQLMVGTDKSANLLNAQTEIESCATSGADMVVLPECFNCPYSNDAFPSYAEHIPNVGQSISQKASPTCYMLSKIAAEMEIYLVGGSIPEKASDSTLYNTCTVYNPKGELVAKHRKVHLFDINVPGKIRFMESDTLSAGNSLTTFFTPWFEVGVGICYDIRFGEMAALTTKNENVGLLVYPGAFNTTTGPLHWELLARARAVDNQVFVCVASPARCPGASYQAWGHTSIVSPWGRILSSCDEKEATVLVDINVDEVNDMRQSIPVRSQRRTDLYNTILKSKV